MNISHKKFFFLLLSFPFLDSGGEIAMFGATQEMEGGDYLDSKTAESADGHAEKGQF